MRIGLQQGLGCLAFTGMEAICLMPVQVLYLESSNQGIAAQISGARCYKL